jgi:hypothetical protein
MRLGECLSSFTTDGKLRRHSHELTLFQLVGGANGNCGTIWAWDLIQNCAGRP